MKLGELNMEEELDCHKRIRIVVIVLLIHAYMLNRKTLLCRPLVSYEVYLSEKKMLHRALT